MSIGEQTETAWWAPYQSIPVDSTRDGPSLPSPLPPQDDLRTITLRGGEGRRQNSQWSRTRFSADSTGNGPSLPLTERPTLPWRTAAILGLLIHYENRYVCFASIVLLILFYFWEVGDWYFFQFFLKAGLPDHVSAQFRYFKLLDFHCCTCECRQRAQLLSGEPFLVGAQAAEHDYARSFEILIEGLQNMVAHLLAVTHSKEDGHL